MFGDFLIEVIIGEYKYSTLVFDGENTLNESG